MNVRTDYLLFAELQYLFAGARSLFLLGHRRSVGVMLCRRRHRRGPLGGPSPSRPRPRQRALERDPLDARCQVAGNLVHAVEPTAGMRSRRVVIAPATIRPVCTRPVEAGALGGLRRWTFVAAVSSVAAAVVVVVVVGVGAGGGGGRRRSPQSHPDHRPPPGVYYTLDGRRRRPRRSGL